MSRQVIVSLVIAWCGLVALGLCAMSAYELTPGAGAAAHDCWPTGTSLTRDCDHPTLVMFVHPRCPCSFASLSELTSLAERCRDRLSVRIIFVRPVGLNRVDKNSPLWKSAEEVPGAMIVTDPDGVEAARFGARTSGEALLYARDGRLIFQGGLTWARGHSGGSVGQEAVLSLIETGRAAKTRTAVFGCPLFDSSGSS